MNQRYAGKGVVVLVPTKDRPEKIRNLLESLAAQTVGVGRIVIVDGGKSILDVVQSFSDRLPVEHYICQPPGQIRQRNFGISLLDEARTPLVAFLDDDIVLDGHAVAHMLDFWSNVEEDTAAVSFNITNAPRYRPGRLWSLFGIAETSPGKVLKSGYSTSICNVEQDIKSEWVIGGATVWRLAVLKAFPQKEIAARWAVNEDVIYSYPIGKEYPLYVCAGAKVRHEHVFDQFGKAKSFDYIKRGCVSSLWKIYFISLHEELSISSFIGVESIRALKKCLTGLLRRDTDLIQEAWGQVIGLLKGGMALVKGQAVVTLLVENSHAKA